MAVITLAWVGFFAVIFSAVSSLAGMLLGLVRPSAVRALCACRLVSTAGSLTAFGLLAVLTTIGDRTVSYVAEHCAPDDAPMAYRVSAVWAGQAGGLLLWCAETALIGLLISACLRPRAVGVLLGLQGCLLALVAFKNPFAPAEPGAGAGLNPQLADPMMLIHPPMVFLGYALLSMPYALTTGALLARERERWASEVWPWLLVAWLALTAGNGFGASWAYRTFGWGGFWSWDPVENTSLVPWLLAGASVHALCLGVARSRWLLSAAVCALGSFLSVLYGSFLARSGMLKDVSVHAYVGGERLYLWALSGLLLLGAAWAVALLILRWRSWGEDGVAGSPAPEALGWGVRTLAAMAVVVLGAMSLPMFGIAPSTTAYNTLMMPFGVALVVLLAWPQHWSSPAHTRTVALILAAVFGFSLSAVLVACALGKASSLPRAIQTPLAPVLIVVSVAVVARSVAGLLVCCRPSKIYGPPVGDASDEEGPPKLRLGMLCRASHVAHLGVGLFLLGACASGYGSRTMVGFLPVGESTEVLGRKVALTGVTEPSPDLTVAELSVDGRPAQVQVEHHEAFQVQLRKPAIVRRIWGDYYVTPMAILAEPQEVEGETYPAGAMLQISHKPGMLLVWLGLLLIALGLLLALLGRTAEARRSCACRSG